MDAHRSIGRLLKIVGILIGGFVGWLLLVCLGLHSLLLEIVVGWFFGWVPFLGRVLPQLHPDPGTIATFVVCLGSVVIGGHWFLGWLYRTTGPEVERRWPWKWTIQMVGLLVLMFAAGIAVTGVAHQTTWLITSPESIFRRDNTGYDRVRSQSHLREMAVAVHNHAGDSPSKEDIPQMTFDSMGRPMHSWQTTILPYIDQNPVFEQINFTKPWSDPTNAPAMATRMKVYLNPSINSSEVNGRGASHYAGNVDVFLSDRPRRIDGTGLPRGASNTILIGEAAANHRAWGDPLNVRDPRLGMNQHPEGYGGPNGRRPCFVMADASTRMFDPKELLEYSDQIPE